ncbi:putative disease resistance protein RGA3 [Dioscorea cayenensis subsp. rotundata]|uniref:Disease resistance protein RGA3 n=1 Tax=Dioscorea cayennensis subsp. rotundata TaxID=55577 RepID=A0AB40BPM4_DIOCR|nr:putative disease resistance protein RGA3 [Dioscorea cayenensis subsp. rotundata]
MAGVFSNALEMIKELSTPHALQFLEPIWIGVYKQLQMLQYSLLLIQPLIEDAEERQLTDKAVSFMVAQEARCVNSFSLDHNPLLFKLQLGKKLSNVNERINELIEEMGKFKLRVLENNNKPLKNRPQTYSYVDESPVIFGRDEDKEKLVHMLIRDSFDEKVAVVSIVGMGGLGKTTLAQLVYADERVKNHFKQCIWVCVSNDFDVLKLARGIIHTATGENYDHTNMEVLQKDLRDVLGQERYLLVLDDVWNEDFEKWDALRNMLLDGGEGSRILVTTRNEKCSRLMGAQRHHFLRGLSEESSWVLFEHKAFAVGAPKPLPKLVEIGQQILDKCQGLPLAIEELGSFMHYKSKESEWQAVLENIETWKLQSTQNEIIQELWLSYVDLPTQLKKCFAFCAIFPKDHDIKEEQLIQFWMAQGFIPSQEGTDMEVEGREIFTELIRRSLLQNDCSLQPLEKGRVCKMHGHIHDLAQLVMENECFFPLLKSTAAPKIPIKARHWNLYADENCEKGDCSIIHTVLYCRRDLSVLPKLKLVRVLDLSHTNINELPASIEHLHHLRYLDISYTLIGKLPESICMLVNLQTLKLHDCYKLSEALKALPAGLNQLQNLKTLTQYTVGDDAENNIGQLKSLNPFGELALYNLQKVKNADEARKANLGKQFPVWMGERQQFQYLHRIELSECIECEQLPPLETLPSLAYLSISGMDGIKHIINNSRGNNALQSFPALKELSLYRMMNLEGWCVEEGREANLCLFPCLTEMHITECPKLTTMPSIPTLQELYINQSFCETQISLVSEVRRFFKHLESSQSLSMKSCTDNYKSLKFLDDLTISSCKNFTGVSSQGDSVPPFLKSLEVFECDSMRELPTCPTSLQSLSINRCRGIESLGPEMGHLTSLSKLEVSRCPKLVSLSNGMQALTSLQYLSIEFCQALKSFPEGLQQLLPTLKELELKIKKCPELERLCNPGGDYYDLLSTISDKQIGEEPELESKPEQIIQVPNEISIGAKQALKCIVTDWFLLSAILICAIACFIKFLFNQLDNQNEKEFWYIPPT